MKQRIRLWADKLHAVPAPWWVVLLALPTLVPLARAGTFLRDGDQVRTVIPDSRVSEAR